MLVDVRQRVDERALPAEEKRGDENETEDASHYLTGVASKMR